MLRPLLSAVLLCSACASSSGSGREAEPAPPAPKLGAATTDAGPALDAAPEPLSSPDAGPAPPAPIPREVPGVAELSWPQPMPTPETLVAAERKVRKAKKLLKKKKRKDKHREAAKQLLREAIAAYPLSGARFELAAVHVQAGDHETALRLLAQHDVAGCFMCRYRLAFSKSDERFAALRTDPRFQSLTDGVDAPLPDLVALTERLAEMVEENDRSLLQAAIDAGQPVRLRRVEGHGYWDDSKWLTSAEEVRKARLRKKPFRWVDTDETRCVGRCCRRYDSEAAKEGLGPCFGLATEMFLHRVCWWPTSPTTAVPIRVKLLACSKG